MIKEIPLQKINSSASNSLGKGYSNTVKGLGQL